MGRVVRDRYELEWEVAEGPIATLWRARLRADAGFSRLVAVRELAPRYAKDPRFVGTWTAAASELSSVGGPNVEQVLDLVVDGERVYVVTEWVEGLSLARWLQAAAGEPLDWPLVARVGVGVLHALVRPHARQPALVHGGVTPGAVRVAEDGTVKLMRYGAPAALAASGAGRRESESYGLWHSAPEIEAGGAASVASDQLGVGTLLFELLAGVTPFESPEALVAGDALDLAGERPDVPPLFVAHLERALRKEPKERFDSVLSMARALEQLVRTTSQKGDRASLARAARAMRERSSGVPPKATVAGPAALAASLRAMTGSPAPQKKAPASEAPASDAPASDAPVSDAPASDAPASEPPASEPPVSTTQKVPVGLPENRTMAVSVSELKEIKVGDTEAAEGEEAEKKRYKFRPKDRTATKKVEEEKSVVLGLAPQESEAAPLPLTKSKKPKGLSPANTEFLDEDQVDSLMIGRSPLGLKAARTEFLDESQVDRLTIGNLKADAPKKKKKRKKKKGKKAKDKADKRPLGLNPTKTEFLPEDEVDQLKIDD